MSLDPFEARLQFLKLLRNLNASQQSIANVVSFAVKYGARCAEDLWECVVEEVPKASLNARVNILYFLDSLAETSSTLGPPDAPYLPLIERGLSSIVDAVVPETREGILNLKSSKAILDAWHTRRLVDPAVVDKALAALDERAARVRAAPPTEDKPTSSSKRKDRPMSRSDVLQRIEEDRERQKRLRERIWILPIPPLRAAAPVNPSPASPGRGNLTPASPRPGAAVATSSGLGKDAQLMPPPPPRPAPAASPLEVEFEQMWEAAGELDEDDMERMRESAKAASIEVR